MVKRIAWLVPSLALIFAASTYYVLAANPIAQPLGVRITGLPSEALPRTHFFVIGKTGDFMMPWIEGTPAWRFDEPVWIGGVFLQVSKDALQRLETMEIYLGDDAPITYAGTEIRRDWIAEDASVRLPQGQRAAGGVVIWLPDPRRQTSQPTWITSHLAIKTPRGTVTGVPWNWPGETRFFRAVFQCALWPCVLLLMAFTVWFRGTGGSDNVFSAPWPLAPGPYSSWNFIGPAFLVALLIVIEMRDPYYFTQDENLTESLPMILVGCRGYWRGEFPDFNPYIYLGSPLASLGAYALTYPPLPLSYALARHVLGQEYATIDVFVILHLLAGFFVIRLLGRKLGLNALPANLVALSCTLSGPALIMSGGWFNFTPVFVWMPLLLLGAIELRRGPVSWKWSLGMGIALGMAFHVGFSQAAIYVAGFFCLAVLYFWATAAIGFRQVLPALAALLIGAGLALPLVYQQWLFTRDLGRHASSDAGIAVGLPAMLLPYPFVETTLPVPLGSENLKYQGEFYFFGGLFALLFLFQIVGWFFSPPKREDWPKHVWTFLALVALWLALGDTGGLWQATKWLPVLGSIQRHPLRLMPFVVMFVCLAGGIALDRMLRSKPPAVGTVLAALALLVLGLHVGECRTAGYSYHFRPYPELPAEMRRQFEERPTARVSCWGQQRSMDPHFAWLLPQNLPGVYGLPSADGYSALLGGKPQVLGMIRKMREDPMRAMREYGIAWHLWPTAEPPSRTPVSSFAWTLESRSKNGQFHAPLAAADFERIAVTDGVLLTRLPDVSPLAFAPEKPHEELPLAMNTRGVDVDVSGFSTPRRVIVNFLYYPNMRAYVDDAPVPLVSDRWYRMEVPVPAGKAMLSIRYEPSWATGFWMGVTAIVAGLVLAALSPGRGPTVKKESESQP